MTQSDTHDTNAEVILNSARRNRRYCFTLNNYTDDDLTHLTQTFDNEKYIIGKEVGENGTPHLQGYVEFTNGKWFSALKKINEKIHWEVAKGTKDQNTAYCSKGGTFVKKN